MYRRTQQVSLVVFLGLICVTWSASAENDDLRSETPGPAMVDNAVNTTMSTDGEECAELEQASSTVTQDVPILQAAAICDYKQGTACTQPGTSIACQWLPLWLYEFGGCGCGTDYIWHCF